GRLDRLRAGDSCPQLRRVETGPPVALRNGLARTLDALFAPAFGAALLPAVLALAEELRDGRTAVLAGIGLQDLRWRRTHRRTVPAMATARPIASCRRCTSPSPRTIRRCRRHP